MIMKNRPSHISAADWADLSLYIPERDGPFMKDGQRMRVSLMMTDSNQDAPPILHRPGAVRSSRTTDACRGSIYPAR
jgi:hypothetical protein